MTFTTIAALIGSVSAIIGGIVYVLKFWKSELPTAASTDAEIAQTQQTLEQQEEQTGRPQ